MEAEARTIVRFSYTSIDVQVYRPRSSSGSLAMLAAMRRFPRSAPLEHWAH
jgi:hypothetical protein